MGTALHTFIDIFSADFSRKDTGFSPRFLAGNGSKFAVTSDLNNKNYVNNNNNIK